MTVRSGVMRDYRQTSFWLETCGDDLTPRPALDGPVECDVATGRPPTGRSLPERIARH